MMRDHLIDDTLADLEAKIQEYCVTTADLLYTPAENELCLVKYGEYSRRSRTDRNTTLIYIYIPLFS